MAELYAEPTTVDETLEALGQLGPDAAIVAGGTDLVVGARSGKRALPEALVAIHRVGELDSLAGGADEPLRLGALVTHGTLEREPVVRERYQRALRRSRARRLSCDAPCRNARREPRERLAGDGGR